MVDERTGNFILALIYEVDWLINKATIQFRRPLVNRIKPFRDVEAVSFSKVKYSSE